MSGPTGTASAPREERIALAALVSWLLITAGWWALALWPVPDAPAWLERTRYVCFGIADDGRLDAGGWVGLIGSPLGMLILLLAGWGAAVRSLLRRARTNRRLATSLASVPLSTLVLAAVASARVDAIENAARAVPDVQETSAFAPVRVDRAAPPLALFDQRGVLRSLEEMRGRPVILTFAFGHCETVCPLLVRQALVAQAALEADPRRPFVLAVTLDPWRDVPSRLPSIANAWQLPARDAWVLGGSIARVEETLDAWRVPRQRDLRTGDITHPALVYIIDAAGRIAFETTGGAGTIAALIRRL